MEKLFERSNIGLQQLVAEDGLDKYFAYTEKLLSLNVLIECYTAVLDDSEADYEEETAIFAITYNEERSYSFALFVSSEVIGPLILFRIIVDAINFIEHSSKDSLLDDLEEISTGCTTSDVIDNIKERKEFYEDEVWEFKTVLDLIHDKGKHRK
ncbi:MAG: hypothetical protein BGO55_06305 [Sphingobacteriales bacterium 50-39]|nr:hypothetical protein [Sphingobacteriales bacterium]OJW52874.1 MAG: hypothetical protein BGO55_06305 [Sphingobacteriales bacterium 50-39]